MTAYYWVGGSANWNSTNTANWSLSSGGAGGAGPPVAGDDVTFDAGSDSGAGFTVTVVATGPTVRNLTIDGLDQTMALAGTVSLTVQGSITLPSTGSALTWSHTGALTLSSNGAQTITTNGVSLSCPITINKTAGTAATLASHLTIGSTRAITLTQGTFDAANFNVTCGALLSSNSNTRVLTMGSGTWTLKDNGTVWNTSTATGLTLNANTSTIVCDSGTAKTFTGGGLTFYTLRQGGAGVLTIAGSNTFNDWSSAGAYTFRITAGTTQTFTNFTLSGTAGNLVVLDTTSAGSAASLSKASGTVSVSYLSIKDSTATGGATWNATNSTDVSGNTGWNFGSAPADTSAFFMFLR